ncbi:hypothetical protein HAX54_021448, partial [Datura stramonium]|nr:hypothetical protein [Datura stramonium]
DSHCHPLTQSEQELHAMIQSIAHNLSFFCKLSGQKINTNKSKVFYSKNCQTDIKNKVQDLLHLKASNTFGKYLGFPILNGKPMPPDIQNDASIGGVIRNSDGDWIMGYYQKIHALSHTQDELTVPKKLQNPIIQHNYREGNKVEHLLAKEGLLLATYNYVTTMTTPPSSILVAIKAEKQEAATIRI